MLGFSAFAASLGPKVCHIPKLGPERQWQSKGHRYREFTGVAARRAQEINFYKSVGMIAGQLFFVSGPVLGGSHDWRRLRRAGLKTRDKVASSRLGEASRAVFWATRLRPGGEQITFARG